MTLVFIDSSRFYITGIILVAINPYQELPIYGIESIRKYEGRDKDSLDPHIFAVAEAAFAQMDRKKANQSIIVSGESGAGKTVSAKYVMRYFASVSGSNDEVHIEQKVLASNPIMEAIGNAKTTQNDNSSRFGKYIELDFTKQCTIMGANMRTYLLEKSRVVFQAANERNYHIFYQLKKANQSIIVSGESGAGKTVSAKYVMRYFASVSGSNDEVHIEQKVLASNPIMEAIGNAKTTQNDNSSRFGKYIELDFTKQCTIMGANMRTYLLEKSRVVFQAANERNYHIFYQLCSARNLAEMKPMRLVHQDKFHYLNQGGNSYIDGIDDSKQFLATQKALKTFGISCKMQFQLFRVLAAILHIGNIAILDSLDQSESCRIPKDDPHLQIASDLLQVDRKRLAKWLTNRHIVQRREVFKKPMVSSEAVFARDALAKHIYMSQFAFIVECINKSLTSTSSPSRFIGILDIYGFESFDINSFEQFCINYANEKLQQQYCQHVFKLEQEEYSREEIDWKSIDFYDNQPCIDLIEGKPLGILSLLDEECRMPNGSDKSWIGKLYDKCKKQEQFNKPRLSNSAFIISHFADQVQYECAGFLEKNRDIVYEELIAVARDSHDSYVAELFLTEEQRAEKSKKRRASEPVKPSKSIGKASTAEVSHSALKHLKQTVGSQFRDSLNQLMKTLTATTPHYVRCIKPNRNKKPFSFDPKNVTQQLRACGDEEKYRFGKTKLFLRTNALAYMETCLSGRILACHILIQKISRGYLSRRKYTVYFFRREEDNVRPLKQRNHIGQLLHIDEINSELKKKDNSGNTAFLHTYRLAEKIRRTRAAIKIQKNAVVIQKHFKGYSARRKFKHIKKTVLFLQTCGRGLLARKSRTAEGIRRTRAAIIIQKNVRTFICRRRYQRLRASVIQFQTRIRGRKARLQYGTLLRNAKVLSPILSGITASEVRERASKQVTEQQPDSSTQKIPTPLIRNEFTVPKEGDRVDGAEEVDMCSLIA
ncbi:unnamed protein product [Darwinula stevensoni]|uniref:Myosin motor domain-containing protein n=1 Tax=Darwinula stevensoni TaxID=69355 RepID=A0A7R8XAB8_9CRUS|nr:unnamed protein product [Darwinula stevensoni]CAG0891258.1 unnamed protein product [Darwinula stevensoni]